MYPFIKLKVVKYYSKLFYNLHKRYRINYGGCCFVAYCIAKKLEFMKEPFWLIIQYGKTKGNHYCILSKKYGFLNKNKFIKNYIRLKASSKTILCIYNENQWSRKYNKRNNKKIKRIIWKKLK